MKLNKVIKIIGEIIKEISGFILFMVYLMTIWVVLAFLTNRLKISLTTIPFTDIQVLTLQGNKEEFEGVLLLVKYIILGTLVYLPMRKLGNFLTRWRTKNNDNGRVE